jgi:type VI secretion system secreted protein Hcp
MAQVDHFLKIDGIEGESLDAKHKNEIELTSWSFGATQSGSFAHGSGGGVGKVHMQDFHFTMPISKASPKLLLACATGEHIKKAVLTARKAGKEQQEYMKITFSDLLVSSYQTGGAGGGSEYGGGLPVDSISINFAKFEVEYKAQEASGQLGGVIKAGYDLKLNKAV